jgi:hypothetical protein
VSVINIRGIPEERASSANGELGAMAPQALLGRTPHPFARGELR